MKYSSKHVVVNEIEETWEPEFGLDDLFLKSLPPRDEKDELIDDLKTEVEAQKLINSCLSK